MRFFFFSPFVLFNFFLFVCIFLPLLLLLFPSLSCLGFHYLFNYVLSYVGFIFPASDFIFNSLLSLSLSLSFSSYNCYFIFSFWSFFNSLSFLLSHILLSFLHSLPPFIFLSQHPPSFTPSSSFHHPHFILLSLTASCSSSFVHIYKLRPPFPSLKKKK